MGNQGFVTNVDLTATSKLPVQKNMDGQHFMLGCVKSSRYGRKQSMTNMDTEEMMVATSQTITVTMIREHQVRITNKWTLQEKRERTIS